MFRSSLFGLIAILLTFHVDSVLAQRCGHGFFLETSSNFYNSFLEQTATTTQIPPITPGSPCANGCHEPADTNGCCPCMMLKADMVLTCLHTNCVFANGQCQCTPTSSSAIICLSGKSVSDAIASDQSKVGAHQADAQNAFGTLFADKNQLQADQNTLTSDTASGADSNTIQADQNQVVADQGAVEADTAVASADVQSQSDGYGVLQNDQRTAAGVEQAQGRVCTGPHDDGPCWVLQQYPSSQMIQPPTAAAGNSLVEFHTAPAAGKGKGKGHKEIHHCIGKKCGQYRVPLDHPLATKEPFDPKKDYSKKEAAHHAAEAKKKQQHPAAGKKKDSKKKAKAPKKTKKNEKKKVEKKKKTTDKKKKKETKSKKKDNKKKSSKKAAKTAQKKNKLTKNKAKKNKAAKKKSTKKNSAKKNNAKSKANKKRNAAQKKKENKAQKKQQNKAQKKKQNAASKKQNPAQKKKVANKKTTKKKTEKKNKKVAKKKDIKKKAVEQGVLTSD